jgi:hypothetical protein
LIKNSFNLILLVKIDGKDVIDIALHDAVKLLFSGEFWQIFPQLTLLVLMAFWESFTMRELPTVCFR